MRTIWQRTASPTLRDLLSSHWQLRLHLIWKVANPLYIDVHLVAHGQVSEPVLNGACPLFTLCSRILGWSLRIIGNSSSIILQSIRIGKKSERYEIIISHYCIAPDCIVRGNSTRQRNCFRKFFSRKPYYWQGAGTGFEVNLSPMILGASQQIK